MHKVAPRRQIIEYACCYALLHLWDNFLLVGILIHKFVTVNKRFKYLNAIYFEKSLGERNMGTFVRIQ